jgi:hypothetical protein
MPSITNRVKAWSSTVSPTPAITAPKSANWKRPIVRRPFRDKPWPNSRHHPRGHDQEREAAHRGARFQHDQIISDARVERRRAWLIRRFGTLDLLARGTTGARSLATPADAAAIAACASSLVG